MPSRDSRDAPGRLGAFAIFGAAAGTVPLPWVPSTLMRRIRGALVHDVATRHGVALSPEARTILAEPSKGGERPDGPRREAMRFLTVRFIRRFGPVRAVPPLRCALDVFVLGRLLGRYFAGSADVVRERFDADEALRVRRAIDAALLRALTGPVESEDEPPLLPPGEELRDDVTRTLDNVLISTAAFPGWLVSRLDAAFEDILAHE